MKNVMRALVLIVALYVVVGCGSAYAYIYEDEEVPIAIGSGSVTLNSDVHQCYFTADEDHGYTFTIRARDYAYIQPTLLQYYTDDDGGGWYSSVYDEMYIRSTPDVYTGAYIEQRFSFYCCKGVRYACNFDICNPEWEAPDPIQVSLTKTNKAGVYNGLEYWSGFREGEEVITILGYDGNASELTIPGSIAGMRVDTICNYFISCNSTVRVLRFEEGIRCLRNSVAYMCPNLKKVYLPSTFDELARKPFNGCPLEEIVFPKGNSCYSWKNHCLMSYDTLEAYYGTAEEFHVWEGVDRVFSCAFENTNVRILYLTDSVKNVYSNFQYFDEIHVAASFCDIEDQQWFDAWDGNKRYIGTVYGKHNSLTEKQAAQYGIPFVEEGGDAQQYYEVATSDACFVDTYSKVYRYAPDDCYYGIFTAPQSGKYVFWVPQETGFPVYDSLVSTNGTSYKLSDEPITTNEDNDVSAVLKKGERYILKLRDNSEEVWGAEKKTDYFEVRIQTPTGLKAYCDYYNPPEMSFPDTIVDLPAIKLSKLKAAKRAMTVKWKKLSKNNQKKIASIQIQYSPDKKFKKGVKTVTAKKSAASKKIKKLKSKKKYYVRIRSYKMAGGVKHISNWSFVKKVKVK